MLTWIASLILHLIIVGSVAGCAAALVERMGYGERSIRPGHGNERVETVVRAVAAVTGLAGFFLLKMSDAAPVRHLVGPVRSENQLEFAGIAVAVPLLIGFITAAYYIRSTGVTTDRAIRLFVLVGTAVTACLVDVYVNAWFLAGFRRSQHLVPDLAVVAGVGIHTILGYDSAGRPDPVP
ncbi:hypothetical protein [Streptomyces sp. NPDC097619]|uniref:hypothetical protein n=1 Tax=Streptomyces sp. NPDC097619 TaxID=3157228 RepID=UPI003325619D